LRGGKRSLYKLADPFLRVWFRAVAPNRAALVAGSPASRRALLDRHWDALVGQAWEDLCRESVPRITRGALARLGPWQPARRYWHGGAPEWDLVADSIEGDRTLAGEAWFARKPVTVAALTSEAHRLAARPLPPGLEKRDVVRALLVPAIQGRAPRAIGDVQIATLAELV
jgi:hypothetical protein